MAASSETRKKKYQHGSIVRLYLRDFMQYNEMEVKPGPTLNVIIGPNGSGKSSIVNGLALALGMVLFFIFINCPLLVRKRRLG